MGLATRSLSRSACSLRAEGMPLVEAARRRRTAPFTACWLALQTACWARKLPAQTCSDPVLHLQQGNITGRSCFRKKNPARRSGFRGSLPEDRCSVGPSSPSASMTHGLLCTPPGLLEHCAVGGPATATGVRTSKDHRRGMRQVLGSPANLPPQIRPGESSP